MKTEIRLATSLYFLNNLKYFNDKVSMARSELIREFGKIGSRFNKHLFVGLEYAEFWEDGTIAISVFELRVPLITKGFYDFSNIEIWATNKEKSLLIKKEIEEIIKRLRKEARKNI